MKYFLPLFFLFLHVNSNTAQTAEMPVQLEWDQLALIPPAEGQSIQPGLAGAFVGVHNDALLIAGGANFPEGGVWEGGKKAYHKAIYILEKKEKGSYQWFEEKSFSLPQKLAYGLSIPTSKGLFCVGGMDEHKKSAAVFLLQWDAEQKEISIKNLTSLPLALANLSGGKIGSKIYVAGSHEESGEKYFASFDLSQANPGWEALPTWGGAPRTHAFGVVQNNGEEDCFYLIKGRFRTKNPKSTLLTDTWVYHPTTQEWKVIEPSEDAIAFPLAAGTAMAVGANHILLLGGDDGQLFNQLEQLGADIQAATDTSLQQTLIAKRDDLLKNHPGFTKDIWAFHTITQTWTPMPPLPAPSQVTTTAVRWEDQILIPSGEIAPCIRTPKIMAVSLQNKISFGTINYVVLMVYLAILIGIGLFFSKNQHSTEDFFKGGHRIPWWAAGLSIFGTQLSAITFMAVPAKTFATDWLYFFLMMTILMVAPFIIRFFLPFYRRFKLTTAYEYLELRFNLATRLLGSTMYIFLQIGRLGIVLLLPSLALSVVTGIDVYSCILSMGILSILYTVLGGIEAVIWTDVVQVIVLLGGALLSLILLFFSLDSQDISTYVTAFQKTRIFDFEWSFSHPTLWVVLIGGFATNLIQYGSDQTVIQRYLTTKDEKSAAKSIRTGAYLALPSTLLFFSLGTLLFVYYKTHPALLSPILEKTDTIFPWYIVNSLPQGVSGLLIAAIFAASMSSLDSSMNSVATVITTDFFRRLRPLKNEAAYLQLARRITIIIGIMGTGLALMMASWGISSLWDQFNLIVGLFAGGLGGVFLLGIFSKTANGSGALIGLLLSGLIQYYVKSYTQVHLLLYAFTGMISCILIGYWVSKLLGQQQASKMHYTYYHMKQHSQTADVNHF